MPQRKRSRSKNAKKEEREVDAPDNSTVVVIKKEEEDNTANGSVVIEPSLSELARLVMENMIHPDPTAVARGMEKLHGLVNVDRPHWERDRAQLCGSLGAHCLIVASLRKWLDHPDVQEWGCFCIESLSFLDCNEDKIIDCGGVEAVLNALNRYPHHLGIQWGGCGALRNLLSCSETASATKQGITHKFVHDHGGLATVVRAMERFPSDQDVVLECLILVQNLGAKADVRRVMIESNVGNAVVSALNLYPKNSQVSKEGMRCLKNIFGKP